MKKIIGMGLLCFVGFAATARAETGDAAKGQVGYAVCMACHGAQAEGNKMFNSPRLAGQEPWYIKSQLLKFRHDIRGADAKDAFGMQMAPMAKILADEKAIDNIIAYIGTLQPTAPVDRSAGEAEKGQVIYATCATCHGVRGEGNPAQKAPRLVGQHAWYIKRQLKNFKEGVRGSHPEDIEGKLMVPMSQLLTNDQAIEDITAYIQSLGSTADQKP